MLDDAEAEDHVEAFRGERQVHDVGLRNTMRAAQGAVQNVGVDSGAEIDGGNARAAAEEDFGETPGAAAAFEHVFAGERVPVIFAETSADAVARDGNAGEGIELCGAVFVPLGAEMIGVIGTGYEARNAVHNGVFMALRANEPGALIGKGMGIQRARPGRPGGAAGIHFYNITDKEWVAGAKTIKRDSKKEIILRT